MVSGVIYADYREYNVVLTPDVVYARRETGDLKLQILTPEAPNIDRPPLPSVFDRPIKEGKLPADYQKGGPANPRRYPLIVCAPGSGWRGAQGYTFVPRMMELAKQGYVVACAEYRGAYKDDAPHPAQVQDVKEAVRFMRANADAYLVDTDRVALLGDSSGGHCVAFAALTGSDPEYNIGGHLDCSGDVKSCVIFYGPVDFVHLIADRKAEGKKLRPFEDPYPIESWEAFKDAFDADPQGCLQKGSPINLIEPGKRMPAFLFCCGDMDPIIPVAQGERFCDRVVSCGGRAEFYRIAGGGHGAGCWNRESMNLISRFLAATL